MPTPALSLDALSKAYGRRRVLEELSLTVEPGECFALVGVNGAGKTTCIKVLLDFCRADSGSAAIFGVPHTRTVARGRLAFLPERFLPPYYLTGRDFLRYMARLQGRGYEEERAARSCRELDLDADALERPVREYSKGMAQKLGLVSCLLSGKELMVLDEPMSGLDPKARLLVKRRLGALHRAGTALFLSTHMLADVAEICDRMAILHGGRLHFLGTPGECVERFGGTLEEAYLACISEA